MSEMKKCKKCATEISKEAKICPQCRSKLTMPVWQKVLIGFAIIIFLSIIFNNKDQSKTSTNETNNTNGSIASNQQQSSQSTVQPKSQPTPIPESIIAVSASDLANAFENNEIKANGNYKDKKVKVSGTISDIGEVFGSTFIVLSSGKDFSLTNVQCFFENKEEITKIKDLNKGDSVTVIGKVDGKSMNVSVRNCIFAK